MINDLNRSADQGDDVRFICIDGPSMVVPPPPRFTFGDFAQDLAAWYYFQRGLGKIGVYLLQGFELVETHLLRRNGVMFQCPELNIYQPHIEAALGRAAAGAAKRLRRVEGRVAAIGPGHTIYGHWLVEILPRLYLLEAAGMPLNSLRILLPHNVPKFGLAWLNLMGISEQQLIFYSPEEESIVPDELVMSTVLHNGVRVSGFFRGVAAFLRNRLLLRDDTLFSAPPSRRIFLSRAQTSQARRLGNREAIERIAYAAGFEIIHPEELPILEQVRLFASSKELIGEYGSALHGTMFSAQGTAVCALRGSLPHPAFIQSGLGHVLGHPTGYVFGTTEESDSAGSFIVPEAAFSQCMQIVFSGSSL